jgi:hypothetical protein
MSSSGPANAAVGSVLDSRRKGCARDRDRIDLIALAALAA